MKRFSEEEQEELDAINEHILELDPDKCKREQQLIAKLEEPEESESSIEHSSKYKRSTKRVMSTLAAFGMFASSYLGSKKKSYTCNWEPIRIKDEPGIYDKSKRLSQSQRKQLKQKYLKKYS